MNLVIEWLLILDLPVLFFPGVNTPDHGVMFSTLVTSLQENVSPLVAILKSKDCSSVKNTLSKTLAQLFQNPRLVGVYKGSYIYVVMKLNLVRSMF